MTERLLSIEDVMSRTTLARSTIYKMMKEGRFPQNANIGRTAVWSERELDEFIQKIMEKRQ